MISANEVYSLMVPVNDIGSDIRNSQWKFKHQQFFDYILTIKTTIEMLCWINIFKFNIIIS